jgi:hypothetical protein
MKLSSNMSWAAPFLDAVEDLVPMERVTEVKGYTVAFGKRERQEASILEAGGRFRIQLLLTENEGPTRRGLHLENLLAALAHELAHTVHWPHTPEHLLLTAKILQRFARVARKEGVQDTSRRLRRSKGDALKRRAA